MFLVDKLCRQNSQKNGRQIYRQKKICRLICRHLSIKNTKDKGFVELNPRKSTKFASGENRVRSLIYPDL